MNSDQVCRRLRQNGLRFHLSLQKARSFLSQTNIQCSVTHQVAMPAWASKCLKQRILWSLRLSLRVLGPQPSQRLRGRLQLIASQMNREKRQHQVETIRVTAQQYEIVFVAERRKPRFARVAQVPSPSRLIR